MISRNMYKTGAVLMALVTAFTVTGLSGCKSRTVSNEVTTEYDIPDDYNDERPGVTYGNVDEIAIIHRQPEVNVRLMYIFQEIMMNHRVIRLCIFCME